MFSSLRPRAKSSGYCTKPEWRPRAYNLGSIRLWPALFDTKHERIDHLIRLGTTNLEINGVSHC